MPSPIYNKQASLAIRDLELNVYLGWSLYERDLLQSIKLDISIFFTSPPQACTTDQLDDTFCYAAIIQRIQQHVATKKFCLIEFFSHDIYQLVKSMFTQPISLIITITKQPKIPEFSGHIQFSYGDDNK